MSYWTRNEWIEDAKERVLQNTKRTDDYARELIFLYHRELEGNVLDRTFDNTAAIDVEAQETYLQSQGTDTSEMDETALAQANTGSKVFIASNVKFVDAMEDLKLTCNM